MMDQSMISETIVEEKKRIRREILAKRDLLSDAERERGKILLTERILGHQWFYGCEDFLGFASFGSEIDTSAILEEALHRKKRVFLPRVTKPESGEMEFFRITSLSQLEKGFHGILEPKTSITDKYVYNPQSSNISFLLMPGVAFDVYRNRLGYGAGFYDRFLSDKPELLVRCIGVGFACQLMEDELPTQEADCKPYQVICV